jgi:curved DNA-binding protein CbpA
VADAFDILGLPAEFDLSAERLGRAYLQRSASVHPDVGSDESARAMAELNEARRTLESPERRANALLARLGGPTKEKDRSLPVGFLAQMLETREEIEAAAGDASARAQWERWASGERARAVAEVKAMFTGLGSPPEAESLAAIRARLNAWRYVERLIEQLDPEYDPRRADFQP